MGIVESELAEASHPGPPKSLLRRYPVDQIARNVAARVDVSSNPRSTLYDEESSVPPTVPASSGAFERSSRRRGR